eukprot:CAMPEP_0184692490 /NCGR_PEP_ID=MMETSP0313-20130426/952_1 /TAXON_ID=2792 /ORGANISM="Porphyridium aerugineum, Strain SAG 1380-2" /LENGTH=826 /DNA_ID=CAMNT_0027150325 /DNA_START=461 /DNA_END=2941 /DNA_ORIENTATION=-
MTQVSARPISMSSSVLRLPRTHRHATSASQRSQTQSQTQPYILPDKPSTSKPISTRQSSELNINVPSNVSESRKILYYEPINLTPQQVLIGTIQSQTNWTQYYYNNTDTNETTLSRQVLIEVIFDDAIELHLRPDPLLAIMADQAPTLRFPDNTRRIGGRDMLVKREMQMARELDAMPLDMLVHVTTSPVIIPQENISIIADKWDDEGFYTKRNFQQVVIEIEKDNLSDTNNSAGSEKNRTQLVYFMVANYDAPLHNNLKGYLRISLIVNTNEYCPAFTNTGYDLEATQPLCNGNGTCISNGGCSCDQRDASVQTLPITYYRGLACEAEIHEVSVGQAYASGSVGPGEKLYVAYKVPRAGDMSVLFQYLRSGNFRCIMIMKPAFANGGAYDFMSGQGSELPTLYDWTYSDLETQIVTNRDLKEGDKVYILFYNQVVDPTKKGETLDIYFRVDTCGAPGEPSCPTSLSYFSPSVLVIIAISTVVVAVVVAMGLALVLFRRRMLSVQSGVGPSGTRGSTTFPRPVPKKLTIQQIDEMFPKVEYNHDTHNKHRFQDGEIPPSAAREELTMGNSDGNDSQVPNSTAVEVDLDTVESVRVPSILGGKLDTSGDGVASEDYEQAQAIVVNSNAPVPEAHIGLMGANSTGSVAAAGVESANGESAKTANEQVQCSVCLCDFENGESIRIFPCNHFYHDECIDRWIAARVTCPQCRLKVRTFSGNRLDHAIIADESDLESPPSLERVDGGAPEDVAIAVDNGEPVAASETVNDSGAGSRPQQPTASFTGRTHSLYQYLAHPFRSGPSLVRTGSVSRPPDDQATTSGPSTSQRRP